MVEHRIFTSVGRGVYRLPFQLPNGRWGLVAVARSGRVIADAEYSDRRSHALALRELERALDQKDPERLKAI